MQANNPPQFNRSKSGGLEKKPPPPIKPKPTALSSAPTDNTTATSTTTSPPNPLSPSSPPTFPRTSITVTDNGEPTSTSFGDLKKAFERNQNSAPLFVGGVGSFAAGTTGTGGVASTGSSNSNNRASFPHAQTHTSSTLKVPSLNSGVGGNRPRSVSTPAPAFRDTDDQAHDGELSSASGEGIDNTQLDFGNLRARFQSQANISMQKPDIPRPKPKPVINPNKPNIPTISPPPPIRSSRLSIDSLSTNNSASAPVSRFTSPKPPSIPAPTIVHGNLSPSSSTLRLQPSSSAGKLPPRLPPAIRNIEKSPTPPRVPSRADSPEVERNPFGSDDDEPNSATPTATSTSKHLPTRTPSKIQSNPVYQQLSNSLNNGGVLPMASIPGRDSVLIGKAAPPAPQRAAPRPVSPSGQGLPPRLPSRSGSAILTPTTEDSPEEKERKHRLDKRRRVIQELLETEISYSKDMLLLQEVYATDMAQSNLFTPADEKIIFMNLGEVVELSLDFIALLTPACGGEADGVYNDDSTFVGEAFLQM
ncbi:hypothetical protein BGZ46_001890, partial [Entomortierella lignicola]